MFNMAMMARDESAEDNSERAFNAWLGDVRKAMGDSPVDEDLAHSLWLDGADIQDAVGELRAPGAVNKWVVDALRPGDAPGWVYNVAGEDFSTEADALRWIETYRPYIGARQYHTRAVERRAA